MAVATSHEKTKLKLTWEHRPAYQDWFLERDGQIVAYIGTRIDGALHIICNRHRPPTEWLKARPKNLATAKRWCEEWALRPSTPRTMSEQT